MVSVKIQPFIDTRTELLCELQTHSPESQHAPRGEQVVSSCEACYCRYADGRLDVTESHGNGAGTDRRRLVGADALISLRGTRVEGHITYEHMRESYLRNGGRDTS